MDESLVMPEPTPLRMQPPPPKKRSPLAGVGAAIIALLAKFKYLLVFLKTGGTMLVTMWIYGLLFGWKYAVGFVLLIFVHECGHLVLARSFGLKVGAPVFIPFMGAMIALKEAPRDAWMEAWVGIGGPIFGTLGALLCLVAYEFTGNPLFRALAYSGFLLNLFNLAPLPPLDGGRIVGAVSPWLWAVGMALLAGYIALQALDYIPGFNFLILLIVLVSIPRVWRTLSNRALRDAPYFSLRPSQRWTIAVLYFGLAALLAIGMEQTYFPARAPVQVTL